MAAVSMRSPGNAAVERGTAAPFTLTLPEGTSIAPVSAANMAAGNTKTNARATSLEATDWRIENPPGNKNSELV